MSKVTTFVFVSLHLETTQLRYVVIVVVTEKEEKSFYYAEHIDF
jgi:hypothetical protein